MAISWAETEETCTYEHVKQIYKNPRLNNILSYPEKASL
jgi:hypothetical protein